mmetsp:Transcript_24030/g.37784  ORF Transcript_24030/g.37784 Transcript_24030/m.37784 type:complete len:274 (-) Transcript_24030:345-1166(-)
MTLNRPLCLIPPAAKHHKRQEIEQGLGEDTSSCNRRIAHVLAAINVLSAFSKPIDMKPHKNLDNCATDVTEEKACVHLSDHVVPDLVISSGKLMDPRTLMEPSAQKPDISCSVVTWPLSRFENKSPKFSNTSDASCHISILANDHNTLNTSDVRTAALHVAIYATVPIANRSTKTSLRLLWDCTTDTKSAMRSEGCKVFLLVSALPTISRPEHASGLICERSRSKNRLNIVAWVDTKSNSASAHRTLQMSIEVNLSVSFIAEIDKVSSNASCL